MRLCGSWTWLIPTRVDVEARGRTLKHDCFLYRQTDEVRQSGAAPEFRVRSRMPASSSGMEEPAIDREESLHEGRPGIREELGAEPAGPTVKENLGRSELPQPDRPVGTAEPTGLGTRRTGPRREPWG